MSKKYIIREIPAEQAEFSYYFEGDCLKGADDWNYNLFIVAQSRNCSGFNEETYKRVQSEIDTLADEWETHKYEKSQGYEPNYKNFSDIVSWNIHSDRGGLYIHSLKNTRKLGELKQFLEWLEASSQAYGYRGRTNLKADPEGCVARYLTIATGKEWAVGSAYGYCQGDYVRMVYCKEHYEKDVESYGEVWLGAAKEFCVIEIDDDGEEADSCYGFIVADCQAKTDADYKRIVCEWDGIKEEEARLEMIESSRTYTKYTYRVA